jgi:hypothetical protein
VENRAAAWASSATVTAMTPRPLPDALAAGPFTISAAREQMVGRGRLRGRDLARPTHGVRSSREPASLKERAAATALALPDDVVFCHSTAARLHGLPLPKSFEADETLHVSRTTDRARIRREGCQHHKGLEIRSVMTVKGLRVTRLADTWADVAADPLCSVDEAVVIADVVARRCGVEALMWAVDARSGMRGLRTLLEALPLARDGSLSPMETRARLLFDRAGLPEPELNVDLYVDGEWVARPDFVWREQRVVVEYDGDHHRTDARQWRNDVYRRQLLEDAGWRFVQLTADDILRSPRNQATVARLARLLDLSLAV